MINLYSFSLENNETLIRQIQFYIAGEASGMYDEPIWKTCKPLWGRYNDKSVPELEAELSEKIKASAAPDPQMEQNFIINA